MFRSSVATHAPIAQANRTDVSSREVLTRAGCTDHLVQIYQEESLLLARAIDYLEAGLLAGAPLLVIATAKHLEVFCHQLDAYGFDVRSLVACGRLHVRDSSELLETFMIGGAPDAQRFRATVGGLVQSLVTPNRGCLRVYGDMVSILWTGGRPEAAIALEGFWNALRREAKFALLCSYPLSVFTSTDGEHLAGMCASHSEVLAEARFDPRGDTAGQLRRIVALESGHEPREPREHRTSPIERAIDAVVAAPG